MKTISVQLFLCVTGLMVVVALTGCTKEGPAGPQGPPGVGSTDTLSLVGFAPGIKCTTCHNSTDTTYYVLAKEFEYATSGHATGGDEDRNTNQCAGCHTNEGFQDRYNRGFANETFNINASSGPMASQSYLNSSPPGCFTCHSPHSRATFTVLDSGAVNIYTLLANQTTKQWNSSSASNLCVKCHQPRMTSTFLNTAPYSWQPDPSKINATDTAKIYTTRWNNHVSGEAAQTLLGFGGFEFSGYTYSNSTHTNLVGLKSLGCEDCHMETPVSNQTGGHTFRAVGYTPSGATAETFNNFSGCNASYCHNGAVTTSSASYWTIRNTIASELSQLAHLMMDTNITKKWSLPQSGKPIPWVTYTVSGTDTTWAQANASSSKPLVIVPAAKAGALWNLQQVMYDASMGIHNYKYTKALLDASIAELNK